MLLTTLIPRMQRESTAIPENFALIQLQETARRFFIDTKRWKTDLTFDSVAEQSAYALDLSSEVSVGETPHILEIDYVEFKGTPIPPTGYQLRSSDEYIVFESAYTPPEAVTDGLVVTLTIRPDIAGTDFPDEFIQNYVDGIVGGAIARCMKIPGRPYYNPSAARDFQDMYSRDLIQARKDVRTLQTTRGSLHEPPKRNPGTLYG